MKAYYDSRGEEVPYKTLAGFRRAKRANSKEYKELIRNLYKPLTNYSDDDIIEKSKENINYKLSFQEAIKKADKDLIQASKEQSSLL